jgi:hypothetical protein
MLRSFNSAELANASMSGAWVIMIIWWVLRRRTYFVVVRLLLARPLWWLAIRLLSVPDARTRYAEFSEKMLAKWEGFLLGENR